MLRTNRPAPQIVAFRHGLGRQIISGSTLSGGVKTGVFVPGGGSVYGNLPGSTSVASNAFILAPLAAARGIGARRERIDEDPARLLKTSCVMCHLRGP